MQKVSINFIDNDPVESQDDSKHFIVKPLEAAVPLSPILLIIPIGIAVGVIYLATRK